MKTGARRAILRPGTDAFFDRHKIAFFDAQVHLVT
jgi:hypothetical protein